MFSYRIVLEVKSVNKWLFLVKMAGSPIGNSWPTKIYIKVLRVLLANLLLMRTQGDLQILYNTSGFHSINVRQMSTWDRTHVKSS